MTPSDVGQVFHNGTVKNISASIDKSSSILLDSAPALGAGAARHLEAELSDGTALW
jgi:hypothetical protein